MVPIPIVLGIQNVSCIYFMPMPTLIPIYFYSFICERRQNFKLPTNLFANIIIYVTRK